MEDGGRRCRGEPGGGEQSRVRLLRLDHGRAFYQWRRITRCEGLPAEKNESLKEGHEPCPRTPLLARPALADVESIFFGLDSCRSSDSDFECSDISESES